MRNQIPQRSRDLVRERQLGRCLRCGCPIQRGAGSWHHRRTRRRIDAHTHCPCNGILLCGDGVQGCHGWTHGVGNFEARQSGLIVSRYVDDPAEILIESNYYEDPIRLDHEGGFEFSN